MKKRLGICLITYLIVGVFANSYAVNERIALNVIQEASNIEYLNNNQGNITKTIIESDEEVGEVTIELKYQTKKDKQNKNKCMKIQKFI